jgi:hypothetical protein
VDKGGGGAIDFVMHVQECDFKASVEWLSGQSLPPQSSPKLSQPRILQLPEASPTNWPAVKQYLTETRGLPADWVDVLHDRQLIYADQNQNAVFVRYQTEQFGKAWIRGNATGASLRGTQGESFHGLSSGSERQAGYFWLRRGQEEVKRVVLVESAIDAISLAALEREKLAELGTTVYLSTDGSGAIPAEALRQVIEQGGQVLVAFDADGAGEKMAWRVAAEVLGVKRMVPAVGKDWNDRLLAEQHPEQVQVEQTDRQTYKALWKWYRVAGEVGHQEAYLKRITEVAREVVDGKGLSEKAGQAMAKDLQGISGQQQNLKQLVDSTEVLPAKPLASTQPGVEVET